ncbi:hypothetical protein J3R83DRAFT_8393 [Lanmaoa asiatica]|nr:hypothetical protein J3R83DRAFT_8393 [Lanmaoa asiatica]
MKRLENYQKPVNNDTHGYDGPIAISNGGQITQLAQDFLRAAHAIGVPFSDDIQDLNTAHGAEIWAKYINRHTGRRSDAATAYVHSVSDVQSNLYLRTNARVSRVIFEGTKAVGVAYVPSRNRANNAEVQETIVRARKYVVLSSGTLGTPQILERSGVGSANLLKQLNINAVSDLPGVGEEYQDHYTTLSIYRVSNESTTLDDFLRGDEQAQKELFAEWEISPEKARLSSNAIDAGFKIRPTEEELKEMGPEFNALWDRYFKDKPDKPVMFGSIVSGAYADHSLLPPGKYITMFQYLEYPASRGKIHIASPNPYVEPYFDSGFMNNKADFAPIRWSYKKTREVARRMDAFRGELTSHHPHFYPASPAVAKDIDIKTAKQLMPGGFTVGIHMGTWHKPGEPYDPHKVHDDIKYSKEDDEAIDNWISVFGIEADLNILKTTSRPPGTVWALAHCNPIPFQAMKSREEGGVVDARLNDNLGTNTYSSALLVGEKGADILCEDLGIKVRTPHAPVPHAPIPKGIPATQQARLSKTRLHFDAGHTYGLTKDAPSTIHISTMYPQVYIFERALNPDGPQKILTLSEIKEIQFLSFSHVANLPTFVEVLREELRKNRELQDNVKQLQGDVDKLQDSEALKRARDVYERARLTSSIKENPRLRAAAEDLKKTGVKVGDAVSEALKTMEESEIMRAISRATSSLSNTIAHTTEPIRNTAAYKTLAETLVDALDDSGSAKHAGFEDKEARRLRRQKRLEKAGLSARRVVTEDLEAGQAVVFVKPSARQEAWENFKTTNPVMQRISALHSAYQESESPLVTPIRAVTSTIGSWFEENEVAQVTRMMRGFDPLFSREAFERELREYIVPEVVDAYLSADRESLARWCSEATYNVLWATMEQYLRQGLISDSKVLDIRQVDVSDGKILENSIPVFVVTFATQEMLLFRNAVSREVVVGAENRVEQCTYAAVVTRVAEEMSDEITGGWKVIEVMSSPSTNDGVNEC